MVDTRAPSAEGAWERDRGREARAPREIPRKGWKDVLFRVKAEVAEDRIGMVAASVAFYAMLAIFPALIALVLVYGLVADPTQVEQQVASVASALPESARSLLESQLRDIVSTSGGALGIGLVVSILGALWAASGGMNALIQAINVVYDEEEKRSFLKLRALSIGLTLGAILFVVLVVLAIGVLPAVFGLVGLGSATETLLAIGRWPLLALFATVGLSIVYRYAPCRTKAKWRWVTWGGAIATLLWLGATALFSFYVTNFGSYNETYGALGGVIVLLLWLYITSYAVLLGAEIDAELEHQTAEDSTVGERAPMGERGAQMADTLGPARA